jgi:hypothetical protein
VLQALGPVSRIRLNVTAGPAGDIVTVRVGRDRERLVLPPLRTEQIAFDSPSPAIGYYGTALYLLQLGSRYGGSTPGDVRRLGSFCRVELDEAER